MRDQAVHALWILSHLLRTAWVERQDQSLAHQLAEEVRILQAELHHTQQVLSGYSAVVSACESRSRNQARTQEAFLFGVIVVVLWGLFVLFRKSGSSVKNTQQAITLGDTGGSSDSDTGSEVLSVPVKPVSTGPVRPSQLGKGKR